MNGCHICGMSFSNFGDFHEHMALSHKERETKTHSSGRSDLGRTEYVPMAKALKQFLVAKGEARMGKENFFESI